MLKMVDEKVLSIKEDILTDIQESWHLYCFKWVKSIPGTFKDVLKVEEGETEYLL